VKHRRDECAAGVTSPESDSAGRYWAEQPGRSDHVRPYVHEGRTSRSLHFSIGQIQSRMRIDDPFALDLDYTRTMMGFLLFMPVPRRIAMIGLGGGSLAKFCHLHLRGVHIDVIEINPHVIELRDQFHIPRDDARFRVIAADGAQHVRKRRDDYDVLLVDGFDSQGQPARLCSRRFYGNAHAALTAGGVMVVNMHLGHRLHETRVARIRECFGDAVLAIDEASGGNQIVFARKAVALEPAGSGRLGRHAGLNDAARKQLGAAFGRIRAAQEDQCP